MKRLAMTFAAVMMLCAFGMAQMEMPKPGPENKKLDLFVGSWTLDGDMKPGPMGPGGKTTETESCEWMDGGFYVVCKVKFSGATMGTGSGISVLGYTARDKGYTYRSFNSWGEFEDAKGTWEGNTLTWTSDENFGGMAMKGRFTMKNISATSYDFSYEISQDGAKWTTVMDGKATKK